VACVCRIVRVGHRCQCLERRLRVVVQGIGFTDYFFEDAGGGFGRGEVDGSAHIFRKRKVEGG
jgi:hypothetical protein